MALRVRCAGAAPIRQYAASSDSTARRASAWSAGPSNRTRKRDRRDWDIRSENRTSLRQCSSFATIAVGGMLIAKLTGYILEATAATCRSSSSQRRPVSSRPRDSGARAALSRAARRLPKLELSFSV